MTIANAFHTLRVWMGMADATESHLTPSHGWLLPTVADARREHDITRERLASAKDAPCGR